MKEKVLNFINENKGDISLFVIVFVVVLLVSALTSLCGADRLTETMLSLSGGVLALLGIDTLGDKVGMRLGDNIRPAILAIIIGVWIALF